MMDEQKKQNAAALPKNGKKRTARGRIIFVMAVLLVGFAATGAVLFRLQIVDYQEYKAKAISQQLRDTEITANRGTIYDSGMKALATSATVWTVTISPYEIKAEDDDATVQVLCSVLGVEEEDVRAKIAKKDTYYQVIKKKIDKDTADQLRAAVQENELSGIYLEQDSQRRYPYSDLASSVIGFVGSDNQGLTGLESYYDSQLTGVNGRTVSAKNGWGLDMDYEYEATYDAVDGNSLVLTLDTYIQQTLEKYLENAVNYHNVANKGVGIVMDVKTGGILAMATMPDYDLNDPFTLVSQADQAYVDSLSGDGRSTALINAREAQWRNKAVSDLYEPGSVFKIVTAAAALDSGAVTLNNSYTCTGSINVAGTTIRCSHTSGHGTLSFAQALINSCNPSFIQIGQQLGAERFLDYLNSFGLTRKTGIDLPGESNSLTYTLDKTGPVELASMSFGQSNKITPLQMATAVCAAVNGGYLVQPHLVSQVLNSDGEIIKNYTYEPVRQVISSEVSSTLCGILEDTVTDGPGNYAYVKGYRVGGKSGTSEKLDSGAAEDTEKVYIASFVGFAPADDPQVLVLIILDEPHSYSYYGGQLAAPVVGSVLSDILPYLGVEASYTAGELAELEVTAPSCVGNAVTATQVSLQKKGLSANVIGSGTDVVAQFPAAGTTLTQGSTIVLYTETDDSQTNLVTVPGLEGRDADAVRAALAAAGLNFMQTGSYQDSATVAAQSQDIAAGTQVPMGTVVTVEFRDSSIVD